MGLTEKVQAIQLGWEILKHKCIYYYFNSIHPQAITDFEYDKLEKKYEKLCAKVGIEPSASNMVDFDLKRPSCEQVLIKLKGSMPDYIRNGNKDFNSFETAMKKRKEELIKFRGLSKDNKLELKSKQKENKIQYAKKLENK